MKAYWREMGAGPRKCLAFHCSLAHSGAWSPIGKRLASSISIRAMDLPGHGQSPGTTDDPNYVETTLEFATEGVTEPVDILGHSFGAYTALRLALAQPDKIKSLWLFEPVFFAAARETHPKTFADSRAKFSVIYEHLRSGDRETAARLFMRDWGNGQRWGDLSDDAQAYFVQRIDQIFHTDAALAQDAGGYLRMLPELTIPVRFVDGSESPPIVAAIQDELAALIPNASRHTIVGASHMAPIARANQCAADISNFLGLN